VFENVYVSLQGDSDQGEQQTISKPFLEMVSEFPKTTFLTGFFVVLLRYTFMTDEIIRQDMLRIKKGRAIADPALWFDIFCI